MARKKPATPDADPPSFEQALGELEAIVSAMEEEQLPLEDLVARYEQGTRLLGHCERVLNSARKRLITIAARSDAAPAGEDSLDDDETLPHHPSPSPADPDDDIRLF